MYVHTYILILIYFSRVMGRRATGLPQEKEEVFCPTPLSLSFPFFLFPSGLAIPSVAGS